MSDTKLRKILRLSALRLITTISKEDIPTDALASEVVSVNGLEVSIQVIPAALRETAPIARPPVSILELVAPLIAAENGKRITEPGRSSLADSILAALSRDTPRKAQWIANRVDHGLTSYFWGLLKTLRARGDVKKTREGYLLSR